MSTPSQSFAQSSFKKICEADFDSLSERLTSQYKTELLGVGHTARKTRIGIFTFESTSSQKQGFPFAIAKEMNNGQSCSIAIGLGFNGETQTYFQEVLTNKRHAGCITRTQIMRGMSADNFTLRGVGHLIPGKNNILDLYTRDDGAWHIMITRFSPAGECVVFTPPASIGPQWQWAQGHQLNAKIGIKEPGPK